MFNSYTNNTLKYISFMCINCAKCVEVCPHGVFAPDGRAVKLVRGEACIECGACQINCPTGAIKVNSGVGCAAAMIRAALFRKQEVTCGGDDTSSCC